MPELKFEKHERLVQEYLIDLNQTQAAIRAGYSPNSANQQASTIFAKPNVRARVAELMAERSKRTGVNQERVIRELARIAFAVPDEVVDMDTAEVLPCASVDDKAAIASVKVKRSCSDSGESIEREVRFCDKLKAAELLGRHLGMFTEKLQLSGEVKVDDARARLAEKLVKKREPGGD